MPSLQSRILFLLLFIALGRLAFTQQLIFKTYGINDGLVHNAVRKIFQDSKGFLWIATWEGLSKYDGHRFTNYSGINGFSNNMVNEIVEPTEGILYITTNDGGIYRITDNSLPQKINVSGIVVNRLVYLRENKTLALTDNNGIHEFREGELVKPAQAGAANNYFHLALLNDSVFLLQSDYSIQLLDHHYRLLSQQKEQTAIFSECGMLRDSKNRIWIGTTAGLKLVSAADKKAIHFLELPSAFRHPLLQRGWIRSILEDAEGNLWFGTTQGLLKIGADGLQQLITEKNGLPAADITCLYQDREKNIWVGGSRGIARLATATSIRIFKMEDGLVSNNISHLLPLANGNLLIQSEKETQLYKKSTGRFEPATQILYAGDKSNHCLSAVSYGLDSRYLVFQQKPFHFSFFSHSSTGQYYAYKDSIGNHFVPTHSGIMASRDLKKWQKALSASDTRCLMLDTKGRLWAGTRDSGLLCISYEYVNGYPQLKEQKHFLAGIGIRSLYEDSKGNIWVGSRHHGIFCMNPNGIIIYKFNQNDGLTSNRIISIAEDKKGAIWLSFYSGLDKLVPENNSYRVFNFSRFHNFFTNIQTIAFDNDHSLWLGTTQGLVAIADGETERAEPANTIITSAVLGDSIYNTNPSEKVDLGHNRNNVHFRYAAPAFVNEQQTVYSYRLLGSQTTEWSPPSNEHTVSFASLKPGDYQFEVRTLGWNRQWGQPAVLLFRISPPFWLAWWFITPILLLVAAVIFYLVRKRIAGIRNKAGLKHKLAEAEMMALRSQMNPHFIFNCLSAIDNLIQTAQADKATTYLSRFAKLMRAILESTKNNLVPFHKDFETLGLYLQLEQFRCNNKFNYELKADEELLQGDFKVPPLIVQPFVENAIYHGLLNKQEGDKKLSVTATLKDHCIRYRITDSGVGRARAYEIKTLNRPGHSSYGIQITTERIHLHNHNGRHSDVRIIDLEENGYAAGTCVEVELKTD